MALAKSVVIKESIKELKVLLKTSKPLLQARIRMLLSMKNSEKPLTKIELGKIVHCSPTSIQTWRSMYLAGGIDYLLDHKTKAARPSIFTTEEHEQLKAVLENPKNGFQGYKELHIWVSEHIKEGIKPNSLTVYCRQKFGTKIKVARKSHVRKDEEAVAAFKKTLVMNCASL